MKKLYLVFLVLVLLFMPTTYGIAVYQLDQPVSRLNGYTLREVFENRNIAMPDISGKIALSPEVFRLYNGLDVTVDYNIFNGSYVINGLTSTSGVIWITLEKQEYIDNLTFTTYYESGYIAPDKAQWLVNNASTTFDIFRLLNRTITKDINDNVYRFGFYYNPQSSFENYTVKVQFEEGIQSTPYQLPTNGSYSDIDVGQFGLTVEQVQTYYDLYLEAVRFENENVEASQDPGDYQNIFKSVINGVRGLISEMGYLWQWLNAPLITSEMSDYSFNIDWSWDLINVIRQLLNAFGIIVLQVLFVVPNLMFSFMGIPIRISILSLLFSNMVFLILGWILVKSFVI